MCRETSGVFSSEFTSRACIFVIKEICYGKDQGSSA